MKTQNWKKLRPEIVQGKLFFFDDNVKGDYPKVYFLSDILSQKEQEVCRKLGAEWINKLHQREREMKKEITQIVLEDVPHQYQERLLTLLTQD